MTLDAIHREVASWPVDLRESWDERAAILEFEGDAGSREEAERRAFLMLRPKPPMRQEEMAL